MNKLNEIALAIILPSAGIGARLPGAVKKQYRKISDKEIFLITIENVMQVTFLKEVIIVIQPEDERFIFSKLSSFTPSQRNMIQLVEGGDTRQHSVYKGLQKVSSFINVVAVHDIVRPFATTDLFNEAVKTMFEHNCTLPVLPIKETIKILENQKVKTTPDRKQFYIAQTPQVFHKQILMNANENLFSRLSETTDDSQLAELDGNEIHTIAGEEFNMKITTTADILYAEFLINNGFIKIT